MNKSMPIKGYMAAAILFFGLLSFSACKKSGNGQNSNYDMVNAQLASDFNFPPGSYWIYKDSVSGETDSAYVGAYNISKNQGYSCSGTIKPGTTQEEIDITIYFVCIDSVAGTSPRSAQESWELAYKDNVIDIVVTNAKDSVERLQHLMPMAVYPFATGNVPIQYGCAIPAFADSANITTILPSFTVNGQSYANTALSTHALLSYSPYSTDMAYNDNYYLTPNTGFVKVIFNHPSISIHRVLELQRYKIAQIIN